MRGDLEWGTIPAMVADSAARYAANDALVDGEDEASLQQQMLVGGSVVGLVALLFKSDKRQSE